MWDDPLPAVVGDTVSYRQDPWMVALIHADGSEDAYPPTRTGGRELWEATRGRCGPDDVA